MSELTSNIFTPIGVISAAILGGLFSFLSLVMSKEQKVSEFRRDWIESLREEVSDFIANAIVLSKMYQVNNKERQVNNSLIYSESKISEAQAVVSRSFTRVLLRLNPNDDNMSIKRLSDNLEAYRESTGIGKWQLADEQLQMIRKDSREILKQEWDRVKKGEPAFYWAKRIAFSVTILAMLSVPLLLMDL